MKHHHCLPLAIGASRRAVDDAFFFAKAAPFRRLSDCTALKFGMQTKLSANDKMFKAFIVKTKRIDCNLRRKGFVPLSLFTQPGDEFCSQG
jgi:hypothetical protein